MHLDDGEADLTSHVHVLAVSVQSHVSSDALSVARDMQRLSHLKGLPLLGRMIASAARCLMVPVLQ